MHFLLAFYEFVNNSEFFRPAPWEDGAPRYSLQVLDEEKEKKEREEWAKKRRTKKIEPITVNNPGPLDPIFEPSEELVALIRADEKNSRRWDECLEKELRKDKWYKHVEEVI